MKTLFGYLIVIIMLCAGGEAAAGAFAASGHAPAHRDEKGREHRAAPEAVGQGRNAGERGLNHYYEIREEPGPGTGATSPGAGKKDAKQPPAPVGGAQKALPAKQHGGRH